MDLELQLEKELDALEDAANKYVRSRPKTVKLLRELADYLENYHRNTNITKTVGGSVGAAAAVLAITGFGLSFFTFGASLGIAAVGTGLGIAAGLTTLGGVLAEVITSRITESGAEKVLKQDKVACDNLKAAVKRIDSIWQSLREAGRAVDTFDGEAQFTSFTTEVSLIRVDTIVTQGRKVFTETAMEAATVAGQSAAAAGALISVVALPLDLYTAITSAKEIKNVPDLARRIREIADKLECPSAEEMKALIGELRAALKVLQVEQLCPSTD